MALKGEKLQDKNKVNWISSFGDSFGSTLGTDSDKDCSELAEKRVKTECEYSSVSNDFNEGGCSSSEGQVWTIKYAPKKLDDLIVHKKKVTEVCDFLKCVFSHDNFCRILLITGPTGCGKTCTLTTACRCLNINILEWVTPINNSLNGNYDFTHFGLNKHVGDTKRTSVQMFNEFIFQATKYPSLLSNIESVNQKIVLTKDFLNVFLEHPEVFHETIKRYCDINNSTLLNHNVSPLIFIMSDMNMIRDLFPDDLKSNLNIMVINFNKVTCSNIVKALDRISSQEINRMPLNSKRPTREVLIDIANSSDGDLRTAILKLQFSLTSCNSITSSNFKTPKSARIKVIKSGSQLKNGKYNICEIDKDKSIDFFSSVGRVLYPKKECIIPDNKDNAYYRFVHSPNSIADIYSTEPNKFINILHENYLERFTNIKDVCHAANSLSLSDLLLSSNWESKDIMVRYSLNTVVYSLMVSNTKPTPNTFRPLLKSKIWVSENKKKENQDLVRQIFPDVQYEKNVLLDVLSYINSLKINIKLSKEENQIISKITNYNK